jgi:hypothetical protein
MDQSDEVGHVAFRAMHALHNTDDNAVLAPAEIF